MLASLLEPFSGLGMKMTPNDCFRASEAIFQAGAKNGLQVTLFEHPGAILQAGAEN